MARSLGVAKRTDGLNRFVIESNQHLMEIIRTDSL